VKTFEDKVYSMWQNAGELGPLTEVCPKDYTFFNTIWSADKLAVPQN